MYRKDSTSSTTSTSSMASPPSTSSSPSRYGHTITSPSTSPSSQSRVQLVPHTLSLGFDLIFSPLEREALENTSFDELDLSSKDFDFEDIFTYDRPQQKLSRVVEVNSTREPRHGERDWSKFSFSHYSDPNDADKSSIVPTMANAVTRSDKKVTRTRSGISEMYLRNGAEARKR